MKLKKIFFLFKKRGKGTKGCKKNWQEEIPVYEEEIEVIVERGEKDAEDYSDFMEEKQ